MEVESTVQGAYVSPEEAKSSGTLLAIYGINCALNVASIVLNIGLIVVTARNRQLHGICQLLIGYNALCNCLLELCEPIYFLITLLPAIPSIPILHCFFIQFLPLCGFFNVISMIFVIGVDRMISIFFPLWHINRSGCLYLPGMIAVSTLYPLYIQSIVLQNALQQPDDPRLCTISDLLAANTSFIMGSAFLVNILSIFCYLIVWAKLRRDMRRRNSEMGSHQSANVNDDRQRIFRSLLIILAVQVAGWSIAELGLAVLYLVDGMSPLVRRQWAAVVNILLCISAGTDPIVLYLNSGEHRNAFCKQFPWLFRNYTNIHSSQQVGGSGPRVAWQTGVAGGGPHSTANNS